MKNGHYLHFLLLLIIVAAARCAEEIFELIPIEGGEAIASGTWSKQHAAANAFMRQEGSRRSWVSNKNGAFNSGSGAYIWYDFRKQVLVAEFGFRNRKEAKAWRNNPTEFALIGSNECKNKPTEDTVIQEYSVEKWNNADGNAGNDIGKRFSVAPEKRKRFRCVGLRIRKISGEWVVGVQDFRMWTLEEYDQVIFGRGKAFASNVFKNKIRKFGPENAFKRQISTSDKDNKRGPWLSGAMGDNPKEYVWYRFEGEGHIIARFSFRNRREPGISTNNPLEFALIGSRDCENNPDRWSPIQFYKRKPEFWSGNDVEKVFDVYSENRGKFVCVGILVTKISGKWVAGIQDIKMWNEEETEPIYLSFGGKAYASSGQRDPENAFRRQFSASEDDDDDVGHGAWMSNATDTTPTVWRDFESAEAAVAKFCLRNRRVDERFSPENFDLVGSDDCVLGKAKNWEAIQSYDLLSWGERDTKRCFRVRAENRTNYRCLGFRFTKFAGDQVAIQDVKFWTAQVTVGMQRLIKKTQMLEHRLLSLSTHFEKSEGQLLGHSIRIDNLENGIRTCSMGYVGCRDNCKNKDKKTGILKKKVVFPKPFASKPDVMVAAKEIEAKAHGWYGWAAKQSKITKKGFEANLRLWSGRYTRFDISWIACGQM